MQRTETDPATHMVSQVVLEIQVPASFPEKYYDALIKSAEQCAVKKHMQAPPEFNIVTTVKEL
jgi:ribosomal protein S12 methylthiotransferase accessory factor